MIGITHQTFICDENVSDITNSNLIFKNLFGELGIFLIEK